MIRKIDASVDECLKRIIPDAVTFARKIRAGIEPAGVEKVPLDDWLE